MGGKLPDQFVGFLGLLFGEVVLFAEIVDASGEISLEDLIADEEMVVAVTVTASPARRSSCTRRIPIASSPTSMRRSPTCGRDPK